MNINQLVRKNIKGLQPYSCARSEYRGKMSTYLDANEAPFDNGYNRYPDPYQSMLKKKLAKVKGVKISQIMVGNGSDEPIDLIFRIFCDSGIDNVIAIEPTYGMYKVCADISNVEYRKSVLGSDFQLRANNLLALVDKHTKVIFLCSPNNPSANLLDVSEIRKVISRFSGIVVIDEAYVDFSSRPSWVKELGKYSNLIVLQTFSKAWGMAAVRCGLAFAAPEIIDLLNKVKFPYNINQLTQEVVLGAIQDGGRAKRACVSKILRERDFLSKELSKLSVVEKVFPSDTNFLLIKFVDADAACEHLSRKRIAVRNRTTVALCEGCLRITVGTRKENLRLIDALERMAE
jgi:histidinol-phosphate aminotransferase